MSQDKVTPSHGLMSPQNYKWHIGIPYWQPPSTSKAGIIRMQPVCIGNCQHTNQSIRSLHCLKKTHLQYLLMKRDNFRKRQNILNYVFFLLHIHNVRRVADTIWHQRKQVRNAESVETNFYFWDKVTPRAKDTPFYGNEAAFAARLIGFAFC